MKGEGLELLESLSEDQITDLITNREVTCLLRHAAYWKFNTLCNIPYKALKMHKSGRYEWGNIDPYEFDNRVIRLKEDWKEILKDD